MRRNTQEIQRQVYGGAENKRNHGAQHVRLGFRIAFSAWKEINIGAERGTDTAQSAICRKQADSCY